MKVYKEKMTNQIERFLSDDESMEEQRQTLRAFDRFNALKAYCRLNTRHGYLQT